MSQDTIRAPHTSAMPLAEEIVRVLLEKQARDVRLYAVSEVSSVTDVYVLATGRSSSHVGSLADDVEEQISERQSRSPLRVEGRRERAWILVDYGEVILHVFDAPSRDFYQLDRLLPETTRVDVTYLKEEVDRKFDITVKEIET